MGRKAADIVKQLAGRRILVIGDMVADIYIDGRISRISREAPVLVLEQAGEKIVAGGAANVAHNAQTLGGSVYAVGLLGEDAAAQGLADILAEDNPAIWQTNRPATGGSTGAMLNSIIADAARLKAERAQEAVDSSPAPVRRPRAKKASAAGDSTPRQAKKR